MALLNILLNARDAMEDRPQRQVTIETANVEVDQSDLSSPDFHHLAPGHYVAVAVTDTGCGMPPDIQQRVLEPFFTTKEEGKGTGLGMSMVYGWTSSPAARCASTGGGSGQHDPAVFPGPAQRRRQAAAPEPRASGRGGSERILDRGRSRGSGGGGADVPGSGRLSDRGLPARGRRRWSC